MNSTSSSVVIASVKEVCTAAEAEIRLKVDALVDGQRSELEIAISTELAPLVALALLENSVEFRAKRDDLAPALEPVAIGLVPSSDAETVRLHLLFEKGTVLPVEVEKAAAESLKGALQRELGATLAVVRPKNG